MTERKVAAAVAEAAAAVVAVEATNFQEAVMVVQAVHPVRVKHTGQISLAAVK